MEDTDMPLVLVKDMQDYDIGIWQDNVVKDFWLLGIVDGESVT
jgi:hypothetical protein